MFFNLQLCFFFSFLLQCKGTMKKSSMKKIMSFVNQIFTVFFLTFFQLFVFSNVAYEMVFLKALPVIIIDKLLCIKFSFFYFILNYICNSKLIFLLKMLMVSLFDSVLKFERAWGLLTSLNTIVSQVNDWISKILKKFEFAFYSKLNFIHSILWLNFKLIFLTN